MAPNELKHVGVKGMRWGVRKGNSKVGSIMKRKLSDLTPTQKERGKRVVKALLLAGFIATAYAVDKRTPRRMPMYLKIPASTMIEGHFV